MTSTRNLRSLPFDGLGRWWALVLALPVVATWIWAVQGGTQDPKLDTTDTQIVMKSLLLGQFAKSNNWPDGAVESSFDLAIHNKPDLVTALASRYAGTAIGAKPLRVLSVLDVEDLQSPEVLYTEAEGPELDAVLKAVKGEPTLVVTALQPTLKPGVAINFFLVEGGLKYEINFEEAEKRGILVGNRIMSCAVSR